MDLKLKYTMSFINQNQTHTTRLACKRHIKLVRVCHTYLTHAIRTRRVSDSSISHLTIVIVIRRISRTCIEKKSIDL